MTTEPSIIGFGEHGVVATSVSTLSYHSVYNAIGTILDNALHTFLQSKFFQDFDSLASNCPMYSGLSDYNFYLEKFSFSEPTYVTIAVSLIITPEYSYTNKTIVIIPDPETLGHIEDHFIKALTDLCNKVEQEMFTH